MKITSEESAADQAKLSLRKYAAWGLVAAAVIAHLLIAARSVGPMYVYDEVGYLAGANIISGDGAEWSLCGSSYAVGYSAALAPLWWLPVVPVTVYQFAALFSAALGALAIWPATALAKQFGAKGGVALAIGALVTLVPTRALMDNYVLAENPLTLLVLCTALLALRLARSGRRGDAILMGVTAGLAMAVHGRAVPLVAVTLAWLLVRAITKRTPWLDALLGAGAAIVLGVGGIALQNSMGGQIFAEDSRLEDLVGQLNFDRVGTVLIGQAFSQVLSWALLTVLGLVACVVKARGTFRREGARGMSSAWWWLGTMVVAQSLFFVWVLAGSADFETRFDIPIFGRYLDPFVVPIAVLGAVTLWSKARSRLTTPALIASITAVVAYAVIVLPRISPEAVWIRFAVPGLMPFMSQDGKDSRLGLAITAGLVLAAAVLLWLSRGRAMVGLVGALAVATALTMGGDILRVDPYEGEARAQTVISPFVYANPNIPAALAADLLPCLERNKLQMELAGAVDIVPTGEDYGDGLIIGPTNWPAAEDAGLKKFRYLTWLDASVWAKINEN